MLEILSQRHGVWRAIRLAELGHARAGPRPPTGLPCARPVTRPPPPDTGTDTASGGA